MEIKTITALKQQKRNPDRVNVHLDGEYAFGLAKYVAAWLSIGEKLDESRISELQQSDVSEVAYQKALHFISYRPRSVAETRTRLRKKGYEPELIEAVISRLLEKEYLNDENFAREWVENRIAFKPRSTFLLRRELFQKGISETISEQVLLGIDDEALAIKAAQKKAHRFARLESKMFQEKLTAYLARRGFNYSISAETSQRIWEARQNETELLAKDKG